MGSDRSDGNAPRDEAGLDGYSLEGASLAVEVSVEGKEVTVSLSGELDMSNVESLQVRLEEELATYPDTLIFDLGNLRFMDSSGIGFLLRTSRVAAVRLRRPSDIVESVIRRMGLSDVLSIES